MSNQIENRMHSSVKVAADGTIMARSAAVASVTHVGGTGTYLITYVDPIGEAEECHELCMAGQVSDEGTIPGAGSCTRISDHEYQIDTWIQGAPPVNTELAFSFTIWRLANTQNPNNLS